MPKKNYTPQMDKAGIPGRCCGHYKQQVHLYVAATGRLPSNIPRRWNRLARARSRLISAKIWHRLEMLKTQPTESYSREPLVGYSIDCATEKSYETGLAIGKAGTGTRVDASWGSSQSSRRPGRNLFHGLDCVGCGYRGLCRIQV